MLRRFCFMALGFRVEGVGFRARAGSGGEGGGGVRIWAFGLLGLGSSGASFAGMQVFVGYLWEKCGVGSWWPGCNLKPRKDGGTSLVAKLPSLLCS